MKNSSSVLLLLSALIISCTDISDSPDSDSLTEIRLSSGIELHSKAAYPQTDIQISEGEQVHVWVDRNIDLYPELYGQTMTADGSGNLAGDYKMYFPMNGDNVNIYALHTNAYFPDTDFPVATFTHSVQKVQTNLEQYVDSDLLYARSKDIARTENDIINARSSKYCTTSIEGIATEIKNNPGRYIIVGLPCHIQAFRLFEEKFKVVKDSIVGHFSIYCSLNKINISTKYYCNRYKVPYEQIRKFSYRDDGCMGYMKFECYDESEKKIPYIHYWLGTHSFFVNKRCLLCNDHFGELADISFGDINIAPYNVDKIGITSIVTKTPFWDNILTNAANDGYIELHDLPKDVLLSSQKYVIIHKKGAGISAMRNIRRWFGLKNPIHDDQIQKATFKMYIKQFASLLMMEVGKRPYLWFIIKILDRYK